MTNKAHSKEIVIIDGVRFSRHPNGQGLVADTAQVDPEVFIGPESQIVDKVLISGEVDIAGKSVIKGQAVISGRIKICNSVIGGQAKIENQNKDFTTVIQNTTIE